MGYFEEKMGQPHAKYSAEFLQIDAEAGPWLTKSQKSSPIDKDAFPRWDIDLDNGVIVFGDDERNGVIAAIQVLGTFRAENGTWLWAWSNPKLKQMASGVGELTKTLEDIPEFTEPAIDCSMAQAWALAAAAAFKLDAETCYCLPGDELSTFVALFGVTVLEPDDPRAKIAEQDAEAAHTALAEYVGAATLQLGGMLLEAAKVEPLVLDPVIEATHAVCDNLEELSRSPVGRDTPASDEALEIAQSLRQAGFGLALPPTSPALVDGVKEMMGLLGGLAKQYGALSEA